MQIYDNQPANQHRQLRKLVADRMRADILNGDLKPGEWLRQEKLAVEYNVSQMPIREALKELTAEGLLEHVPYRGVRVVEFSVEDIEDLYASRMFLEGRAARVAAENITSEEIAELKKMLEQMRLYLQSGAYSEYHNLNRHFHSLIIASSRRTYLTRTLNQIWVAFPSMLWNNLAQTANRAMPSRDEADIIDHEQLVAALESHNGEQAETIARKHIHESGKILIEIMRSQS